LCTKVSRYTTTGLTATRTEPRRPYAAWRTGRRAFCMSTRPKGDAFANRLRNAGTSPPGSGEVVGVIRVKGRRTIVDLACSQTACSRVTGVSRESASKSGGVSYRESFRQTSVYLGIVIALDPAVYPDSQRQPESPTDSDANTDDRVSTGIVRFGLGGSRSFRIIPSRTGGTDQRVRGIDLQCKLSRNSTLAIEGAARGLDILSKVVYSFRRDIS